MPLTVERLTSDADRLLVFCHRGDVALRADGLDVALSALDMAVAPTHPFADYLLPVGIQGAHSIGWSDCFTFQAHHMMNAIATDTAIEPHGASLRDGYRTAEIVDTILRSAASGRAEEVRYRG